MIKSISFSIFILLYAVRLQAEQFSFSFYNDWFAGTNKHFTNAVSIAWLSDKTKLPLIQKQKDKHYNIGMSLSQFMYTPTDTQIATPQYNDIPYVGYLAFDGFAFISDTKSFQEIRLELGVIGNESGAQWAQNSFHTLIGNRDAQGWGTQITTHYTLNALLHYGEITWQKRYNSYKMDWFNHYGAEIGNYTIDAFGGTLFRIGQNYRTNFNLHYPVMKEEAALIPLSSEQKGFGWDLSVGINTKLLAYSYVIQKAREDGYRIESRKVNFSLYIGSSLYYNKHKINFFYQSHSPYTTQQTALDTFGGFIYSYSIR